MSPRLCLWLTGLIVLAAKSPPLKPWERAGAASTSAAAADAGPKPWERPPGEHQQSSRSEEDASRH